MDKTYLGLGGLFVRAWPDPPPLSQVRKGRHPDVPKAISRSPSSATGADDGLRRQDIHIDPYGEVADYGRCPKPTSSSSPMTISTTWTRTRCKAILKPETAIVASKSCAGKFPDAVIMANGERRLRPRPGGRGRPGLQHRPQETRREPFHPKGDGNGYVLTFGDKRVYIAGDTENTPKMKALKSDRRRLPADEPALHHDSREVADAARAFRPKILYPYHYGDTDTSKLVKLLAGGKGHRGPDPAIAAAGSRGYSFPGNP